MNAIINKEVQFEDLGLINYGEAWDYQENLLAEIVKIKIANRSLPPHEQKPTPNFLLFCQHPHVYTLGKSGTEDHILISADKLKKINASYYKTNRGGDITYHGPGQIVGYPILDLDNFFTDIHRYLRMLEEAVILTLEEYGLEAGRIEGLTGVWLDHIEKRNPRKICAIGVKSSRWVTMHGFALNVKTNLKYFEHIIPCGIADKSVTSLDKELVNGGPEIDEVAGKLKSHLGESFQMQIL
ncbi:MAG: lipoyl(octanoyl) transferase LipB [Bacteroidetes bacterium]|nr:lipoyl(octanoyl) transferase LipB [Bacteroidota bacterium]